MMRNPFTRADDGSIVWAAQVFEVGLLTSLAEQLVTIIDAPVWSDDPLERWSNEQAASELDRDDPVIERLFPSAYEDTDDAAEYRWLMEAEQRSAKSADAQVVLAALGEADARLPLVRIEPGTEQAWLRCSNAMRLALGARLGIETEEDSEALDELDEDDPRSQVADVYQWLMYVQTCLLDCLTGD